ncbi:NAD-dependent epimerase/dehydratase family protein [Paenibacillus gorillae]|uniref:NAD-dependent epimerase/dehydratase family protein n=1 Tax=Paenibacillus gorillae TaxID=1243662 RepID=UPI0004AC7B22|nr:NAD-dependent epimerase/dehydratase family protein [Paenibacillus gorillae]
MKIILTGATGMVGEGVLHECLRSSEVQEVLVIGRKPSGTIHPKLKEITHADFLDLSSIADQLAPYDACFFCLGVSSVGMNEQSYSKVTYDLTLHMAEILADRNPGMVFCYVSASGADSTEQGRSMWARIKGRTENALLRLPFKGAYMFRPAYIHPTKGLHNAHRFYAAITWLYPIVRRVMPQYTITLEEIGLAMIHSVTKGYPSAIMESKDMAKLAKK